MDGKDFASGMETNALMDESDIRLRSLCDIEELKQPIFYRYSCWSASFLSTHRKVYHYYFAGCQLIAKWIPLLSSQL
jgi:hypothetical protein